MTRIGRIIVGSAAAALVLIAVGSADARPNVMCPMIYRPVCAMTPAGHLKTFANRCIANSADARFRHNGRCRHGHR